MVGQEGWHHTRPCVHYPSGCVALLPASQCPIVNPHPWEQTVQVYISNFRYTGCVKNAAFDLIRTESEPPKCTFLNVFV